MVNRGFARAMPRRQHELVDAAVLLTYEGRPRGMRCPPAAQRRPRGLRDFRGVRTDVPACQVAEVGGHDDE
jgi:hypothetical protein